MAENPKNPLNARNDITRSFQRVFNFPLDRSTIFDNYEDAVAYAKGDGSDSRKLGKTVYLGQLISVVSEEGASVKVYKVVYGENGTEKPYALSLVGEGGGGNVVTENTITFLSKNGDVTVPAGSNLDEVLSKLKEAVEKKDDGITTADISINGTVFVNSGVPFTNAIKNIADYLSEHSDDDGKISEDITYDGDVVATSGDTVTNALQKIVNQLFVNGGLSDMFISGMSVYNPSTKEAKFNIEAADSDIVITYADDVDPPTVYVELSGISNSTITLAGVQVDYILNIYNKETSDIFKSEKLTTFVDGSKVVELDLKGICENENASFYNENGVEYVPEENGKYKFTIAEDTTEIKVFVTFAA